MARLAVLLAACALAVLSTAIDIHAAGAGAFPECWRPSASSRGYLPPRSRAAKYSSRMVLAYLDIRSTGEQQSLPWNAERFSWLAGYRDSQGKLKDRMFDSFLFLGIQWKDRKDFGGYGALPIVQQDCVDYLKLAFEVGVNNLDAAVATVNRELATPSEVGKVVMMIPYPDKRATKWGTVNGKAIDMSVEEDRITATKWYIDQIILLWEKYAFKNLELIGFYWFDETIRAKPEEYELIKTTANYIHSFPEAYGFHWIPYFHAVGWDVAESLGFDVVTYQPNYAFSNASMDRFQEVAEAATKYHYGVELELTMSIRNPQTTWQQSWQNYLDASAAFHFNTQAMLTFYHGTEFIDMAKKPELFSYYQKLYWLVRGTYPFAP